MSKKARKPVVSSKCLKPFQDRLRELGYVQSEVIKSSVNGVTQYYTRNVPSCGVRVKVELWVKPDGGMAHRVSHAHRHRVNGKDVGSDEPTHEDTVPVTFSTVDGMVEAINFETDRDTNRMTTAKTFTKDFG